VNITKIYEQEVVKYLRRNAEVISWEQVTIHVNAVGYASIAGMFEGIKESRLRVENSQQPPGALKAGNLANTRQLSGTRRRSAMRRPHLANTRQLSGTRRRSAMRRPRKLKPVVLRQGGGSM